MKSLYIRIHKKRLLHIFWCIILVFTVPVSGLIVFIVKSGMTGQTIAYWTFCVISITVAYQLREYRDWIDEKYPKKEKIEYDNPKGKEK